MRRDMESVNQDHPRMRGEHLAQAAVVYDGTGSSPHARGARNDNNTHRLERGIIPACAGSTVSVSV